MAKKTERKITIEKAKLVPKPRAPIIPTKKFQDKSKKVDRLAKYKKDILKQTDDD